MRDISKNIKQLRIKKKMTQDELAEVLFVTRQTVSNYETGKSRPDVDMLVSIAAALDTDVNTVIYGEPADEGIRCRKLKVSAAVILPVVLLLLSEMLFAKGKELAVYTMNATLGHTCLFILRPVALLVTGWCVMYVLSYALRFKPIDKKYTKWLRVGVGIICLFFVLYSGLYVLDMMGVKLNIGVENCPGLTAFLIRILLIFYDTPWIFPILGAALWTFGFPKKKDASK